MLPPMSRAISPGCGVSTMGASWPMTATSPGWSASALRASASRTVGTGRRSSSAADGRGGLRAAGDARARARARRRSPRRAWSAGMSLRRERPRPRERRAHGLGPPGQGRAAAPRRGRPASPAPPRRAARRGAPGGPRRSCRASRPPPAGARRRPCGPRGRGGGTSARAAASSSSSAVTGIRVGGRRRDADVRHRDLAGQVGARAGGPGRRFEKAKVTVASARTQGRAARPVSAESPDGRSTASTRAPCARRPRRWPRWPRRRPPRPARASPVPKMASTTTSPRPDREVLQRLRARRPGRRHPRPPSTRRRASGVPLPGRAQRDDQHLAPRRRGGAAPPRSRRRRCCRRRRPPRRARPGPASAAGRLGDGPPGPLHERRGRGSPAPRWRSARWPASRPRPPASCAPPSSTTTAAATPPSWVSGQVDAGHPALPRRPLGRPRRGAGAARPSSRAHLHVGPADARRARPAPSTAASLAAKRAA